jgi:hypothetical protein
MQPVVHVVIFSQAAKWFFHFISTKQRRASYKAQHQDTRHEGCDRSDSYTSTV